MVSGKEFKGSFDHFFSSQKPWFSLSKKIWNPPVDVYECENAIVIKMEVAGVKEEHLDIATEGHMLMIRGVRPEEKDLERSSIHLLEINYGQFERAFRLPDGIVVEDIQANYTNGFLRVKIVKSDKPEDTITVPVRIDGE
ncbi:Hsp20/alpha crystallin family protein [Candidatus Sumerlaeota bacterium]|nr:Hsp20/alpha crystallin family protein [Candidatus Sumerlaeota bacterium]